MNEENTDRTLREIFRKEMREVTVAADRDREDIIIMQEDCSDPDACQIVVLNAEQVDLVIEWLKEARDSLIGNK